MDDFFKRDAYLVHSETRAFARHVETAKELMRRAAEQGELVLSVSWGKDSTAMLGLALEAVPLHRMRAVHFASKNRLPGFERPEAFFAPILGPRYRSIDYDEMPLEEYIAYLQQVGLPFEQQGRHAKAARRKAGLGKAIATECRGVNCVGLRAEESSVRRGAMMRKGRLFQAADGVRTAWPIATWTAVDVWAFLFSRAIPYHPLYDCETHGQTRETLRNGGWMSHMPDRLPWLRRHFPDQFWRLVDAFPRLRVYE